MIATYFPFKRFWYWDQSVLGPVLAHMNESIVFGEKEREELRIISETKSSMGAVVDAIVKHSSLVDDQRRLDANIHEKLEDLLQVR